MITLDFETFYSREYSLTRLTTEEYVRDPQFEVIGVAVKIGDAPSEWFSGSHEETAEWLAQFPWGNHFVLAHNAMFDAAILSWVFGQKPKAWLDTLSMARALFGVTVGGSLRKLAEHFGLGEKGYEVDDARGLRRADFTPDALARYGDYCKNDVELTYKLYREMDTTFPVIEKRLIDLTIRMFSEPLLELDHDRLVQHLKEVKQRKADLFASAKITPEILNSSSKFAELLIQHGVEPPLKISVTTGKETYAFSKTDEDFTALLEHPNEAVQAIVAARLGAKSTLEETRTERFISISQRGPIAGAFNRIPIPLKYYAAHTGRWGGADRVNLQNLPSRGEQKNKLKRCIVAPEGHVIIDCDSSQIEARVLAWLAGQDDLLGMFARKEDVYRHMASIIYGVMPDEVNDEQRFIGKTTVLGAGYGMGAIKFQRQLLSMGKRLDHDTCSFIIRRYRQASHAISTWWNHLNVVVLPNLINNRECDVDKRGVLVVEPFTGIRLPNGLSLSYPELTRHTNGDYTYMTRQGINKIYGGKVAENLCQAVARCIIAEQMVQISERYQVVLTVHDAIACVVPESEAGEAMRFVEQCMRTSPSWAATLPLNCESGTAKTYGDC